MSASKAWHPDEHPAFRKEVQLGDKPEETKKKNAKKEIFVDDDSEDDEIQLSGGTRVSPQPPSCLPPKPPSSLPPKMGESGKSGRPGFRRSSTVSNFFFLWRKYSLSQVGQKIWRFLEEPESSFAAWSFRKLWDPFILVTVASTILLTLKPQPVSSKVVAITETTIDIIFALEVSLRYFGTTSTPLFLRSFHNMVDLMAAFPPIFVRSIIGFEMTGVTGDSTDPHTLLVCIVPILRVMKTLRRFQKFHLFVVLFEDIMEALRVLIFTLLILVLAVSTVIYLVEPRSNIDSLPQAMWLTIVTVTTVGYGDITPETTAGHLVVTFLIFLSVLYMAMPIGIIGNAFTQIWQDRDRILLMKATRERLTQWGYTARDMIKLFKHFNTDGDGNLSIIEFQRMMHEMQIGLSNERLVELFNTIDKDLSGGIDNREFIQALYPGAYHEIYGAKKKRGDEDSDDDPESRGASKESSHTNRSPKRSASTISARAQEMFRSVSRHTTKESKDSSCVAVLRNYSEGMAPTPPPPWASGPVRCLAPTEEEIPVHTLNSPSHVVD